MDNSNFGSFIRNVNHLCTPTQLSYAVANRYGVSDYSPANIECLGMFVYIYAMPKFAIRESLVSAIYVRMLVLMPK